MSDGSPAYALLGLTLMAAIMPPPAFAQGDAQTCAVYAQRAVQQYQQMRSHAGCEKGADPLAWQGDYTYHFNGCMHALPFLSRAAEKIRDAHLHQCGGDVAATAVPSAVMPDATPAPTPNAPTVSAPPAAPVAVAPTPPAGITAQTPASADGHVPPSNTLPVSDVGLQNNYELRDLGAEAHQGFDALAMNDAGVVVGRAILLGSNSTLQHGVVFDGTLRAVDAIPSLDPFVANAINDSGKITGRGSPANQPFLYDGTVHALPAPNHASGEGQGINAAGKVVGTLSIIVNVPGSFDSAPDSRAFLYDGSWHDLGGLGASQAHAVAINDSDQITGFAQSPSGPFHAFLYDGKMHDLGAVVPGGSSQATAINNAGHIVGFASDSTGHERAFLYDGTMHDLGTMGGLYSRAYGINASGLIVGSSDMSDGSSTHAFVSNGSKFVDLNTRIVGTHTDITLVEAVAINASGQILVRGNSSHPYLLTPTTKALPKLVCTDPASSPHGTGASLEHHGDTATLTFTGICGEKHSYVVARPKFAAGMPAPASDSGGWVYAAPDRRSGYMFNLTNGGDVTSNTLSGPALQMMGQ